jgi:hypothetical protein
MRLGLNLGFWGSERVDYVALAREADRLGRLLGTGRRNPESVP